MNETNLQAPLGSLIRQLGEVLDSITNPQYSRPIPVLSNATVGQHVRHIIELFEELFSGYHTGTVNYDNRRRDKVLENNLLTARQRLLSIAEQCVKADKPLLLSGNYTAQHQPGIAVATNYQRELIYNIEHTVHHMALIRVAVREMPDIILPPDFGIAASTLRYQQSCAQ